MLIPHELTSLALALDVARERVGVYLAEAKVVAVKLQIRKERHIKLSVLILVTAYVF